MNYLHQKKNKLVLLALSLALFFGTPVAAEENATFSKVCKSCHTGGFKGWVSGAPSIFEREDWQPYIERDSVEKMKKIVLTGTEDHKTKGGCKKCSDEEIVGALNYMLSQVQ